MPSPSNAELNNTTRETIIDQSHYFAIGYNSAYHGYLINDTCPYVTLHIKGFSY